MKLIHKLTSRNGGVIYIEIPDADLEFLENNASHERNSGANLPEGAELTSAQTRIVDTLKALRQSISAVATEVSEAFVEAAPTEWAVEINIGFKGKVNPIPVIVSGGAEASLKVVAKWKKS